MAADGDPPSGGPRSWFHAATLPRWRAVFAIACAGVAFLCAGGMLEYGTGSPETQGTAVATYWALLFSVHVAAFGGAGLIAAFPELARRAVKLGWLAATLALYGLAFTVWARHQAPGTRILHDWLARTAAYAPAAVAAAIGLALPRLAPGTDG
jgi:hypothetical protein